MQKRSQDKSYIRPWTNPGFTERNPSDGQTSTARLQDDAALQDICLEGWGSCQHFRFSWHCYVSCCNSYFRSFCYCYSYYFFGSRTPWSTPFLWWQSKRRMPRFGSCIIQLLLVVKLFLRQHLLLLLSLLLQESRLTPLSSMPVREETPVFWEILNSALSQLILEFSSQPNSYYSSYSNNKEEEERKKKEEVTRKVKKTSKPRSHIGRKPIPVVVLTKRSKSSGGGGGSKAGVNHLNLVSLLVPPYWVFIINFQIH